ncbi:SDR family NAD(P)-dependent oxidoreductase [Micromonospora sp. RP3T]|uniref:SDR family NAD(P)-dependent oxidoreductase n=1 Tax=Micromonospora sp. RP3T TaxID=2135446 RepID=UPI001304F52B|nr:SDR family oxidoreductase [Micromonospora sp. RP3T]
MGITDLLTGQHVVVTGGGSGIGDGIARLFAAQGARVSVTDLRAEAAAKTAAAIEADGGTATAITLDVTDEDSVTAGLTAARATHGPVDAVVNSAGAWIGGSVTEVSVSDWDTVMSVNVRGAFLVARGVLPEMVDRGSGRLVMISSVAGLKATRRAGAYNPSKSALLALTRNIAIDYAGSGIRANAICPGVIDGTGMDHTVRAFRNGYTEDYQRWVTELHPLGRLGTPEDVARCALFLASDQSSWMTGTSVVVDGGCMTGY